MNQRWLRGRTSYRPSGELIDPAQYEVAEIENDGPAKRFVVQHHYLQSYPAARFRFGLYHRGTLAGVAVFSVPCNAKVLTNIFPIPVDLTAELGRFVLLDCVPGNGESWFLGRCFAALRQEGLAGIVSHSDPMPRRSVDGTIVFKGHIGTIYQAFNGTYLGRSKPRTVHVLPNGAILSARAIQKIRTQERGWKYASAILERFGADPLQGDPILWLRKWIERLTRPLRHPGNHRYAWALDRTARKIMPRSLPFPKATPLFMARTHPAIPLLETGNLPVM